MKFEMFNGVSTGPATQVEPGLPPLNFFKIDIVTPQHLKKMYLL